MTQLALFSAASEAEPQAEAAPAMAPWANAEDWWISPSGCHHLGDAMLMPNIASDGLSDAPGFTIVLFERGCIVRRVSVDLSADEARAEAVRLSTGASP